MTTNDDMSSWKEYLEKMRSMAGMPYGSPTEFLMAYLIGEIDRLTKINLELQQIDKHGEKDFESFLSMKYGELVNNTEDNTPNEELWERKYNDWLMQLEPDEFIKYANEFKKGEYIC